MLVSKNMECTYRAPALDGRFALYVGRIRCAHSLTTIRWTHQQCGSTNEN